MQCTCLIMIALAIHTMDKNIHYFLPNLIKSFHLKTYFFWWLSFHQLNFEFPNVDMCDRGYKFKNFNQLSNFPQVIITKIIQEFATTVSFFRINGQCFNPGKQFLVFKQKNWLKEAITTINMDLLNLTGFSFFLEVIYNKNIRLKSVHFKKTVSRISFLSKLWYFLF